MNWFQIPLLYILWYILPEVIKVKTSATVSSFRSDYVKGLNMTIIDSQGRIVTEKAWPDNLKEQVLDVSNLNRGMYFIRITGSNELLLTGKLIVNN